MNRGLLKKVMKSIAKHYKNVHMAHWVRHNDSEAPCGTTGCIAGWVIAEGDIKKLRKLDPTFNWEESAAERLELPVSQARRLFHVENWPKKFRDAYFDADTRKKDAKVVVQRIKQFMTSHK